MSADPFRDFDRMDAEQERMNRQEAACEAARAAARDLVADAIRWARLHGDRNHWPEGARAEVSRAWKALVHAELNGFLQPIDPNP